MNFLQLCQALHRELNAGGGDLPGTLPTTVVAQSGFLLRVVNWISDGWVELQGQQQDWRWMYREGTIATTAGTQDYTLASTLTSQTAISVASITRSSQTATATVTLGHGFHNHAYVVIAGASQSEYNGTYQITVTSPTVFTYTVSGSPATPATGTITAQLIDYDTIRPFWGQSDMPYLTAYLTATGTSDEQGGLYYEPWQRFSRFYNRGPAVATASRGRPSRWTLKPDGKLALHPVPDASYTLTIPYRKVAQVLSNDTQVPELPPKFHMLPVYYAMVNYGMSDEVLRQTGTESRRYRPLLMQCGNEQLPSPDVFGAVG